MGHSHSVDIFKTYGRHFGTAKQLAQEAADANGDVKKLATAIRELAEGLTWLAGDVIMTKEVAFELDSALQATKSAGKSTFKAPRM